MSPASVSTPLQPVTALRHRRSADRLTAGQLADFRRAITMAQAVRDERGYQAWVGIHGLPLPISCKHHDPLFLPWHRAYLYLFEKALQDLVPGVTLPWWDWTTDRRVPQAYREERVDGQANPLFDSPIQPAGRVDPREDRTWRAEGSPGGHLPTARELDAVLRNSDYSTFQIQLESFHDGVHIWVGGTMQEIPVAAYDPVFWAHHCMIDRVWYLWQLRHPGAGPPTASLGRALAPFGLTVADTLHTEHLGYDYAATTTAAPGPGHHG